MDRRQNKKAYVWGFYGCAVVLLLVLICAVTRRNPHNFYTILRWVCCVGFVYSAFASQLLGQLIWTAIFGIQAVLFNPLFEFHFRRDTWQTLDKLAIVSMIVGSVMFLRLLKGKNWV